MAPAVHAFARRLGSRMPHALVLAPRFDPADVFSALGHGAIGYLVEGAYGSSLTEALSATARGLSFLDPRVQSELLRMWRLSTPPPRTAPPPTSPRSGPGAEEKAHDRPAPGRPEERGADRRLGLSPRECETVALLASGLAVPEIAHRLSLSEKTVRNTLCRAYQKLNVHRQSEAVLAWLGGTAV
jgi:DNA-binding NarL/FixJ family response regulator